MDGIDRRARLARSRLYLVLDARPHGRDPGPLLDAALRGGVDVVQLRDKSLPDDELVRAAEPFRRACADHGALFVLNDRADLVERAGADGVHVGQDDTPYPDARRIVGADRIVGLSATTAAELRGDPDYFGVGAIHGTPTKPESTGGGLALVRAARDALRVPWFAIGGVDRDTLEAIVASGAPGAAVVRAIRDAEDPEAAARALRAALPAADAVVSHGEDVLLPHVDWLFGSWEPGRRAVAPHVHAVHVDAFFVLAGEMELRLGDGTARIPAGSLAAAPPGLVHGFRNPGGVDARFLNLHGPGVWARGRAAGLPPDDHDTFGVDRATPAARPVLSAPGDGDRLVKPHRTALVKLEHPDIDLQECIVDGEFDGASPHVHLRHTDCFHVLEGALELRAGGATIRADAGTSVLVPPGVVHEFTSVGPARYLNVHAPSCGFTDYLRAVDVRRDVDRAAYDQHPIG